jgi:putative transposase
MPQSYVNLVYHIVFSTKNREPLITEDREERLYQYIGGIVRSEGGITLEINGMPDHLHLLAKLRQDEAVSVVLRKLKANSTGWMHKVFPEIPDFAWQNGYGSFSVGTEVKTVREYIKRQKQHHHTGSFKDEFIALLREHEIEFDEQYLFK